MFRWATVNTRPRGAAAAAEGRFCTSPKILYVNSRGVFMRPVIVKLSAQLSRRLSSCTVRRTPAPRSISAGCDRALGTFGAPLGDLTVDDLATAGTVFQIWIAPNRVDILTEITAVDFEGAWTRRRVSSYGGVPIALLSIEVVQVT